ncbi:MAG TPA: hypothetical protein VGQ14_02745 [Candidatus Eisenbacteria bacterium]|jgi:hypothetical protein|nr:hypothetical protein [Candidatus Eisenbacteria bacterium]
MALIAGAVSRSDETGDKAKLRKNFGGKLTHLISEKHALEAGIRDARF